MNQVPVRDLNDGWMPGESQGPVLFRNAAAHVVPGWSVEWLLAACPAARVPVRFGKTVRTMALSKAIRLVTAQPTSTQIGFDGEAPYITDWDFADVDELRDGYRLPPFASDDPIAQMPVERRPRLIWIYYGNSRSGTPLHQDVVGFHAWSIVISGKKEWVFYPPETDFGPNSFDHDVFAPGAEAADARAGRRRLSVIVEAGDLVFVPSRWWHQVRNFGPTLAVGSNFVTRDIAATVMRECRRLDYPHIAHQLVQAYGSELDGSRLAAPSAA